MPTVWFSGDVCCETAPKVPAGEGVRLAGRVLLDHARDRAVINRSPIARGSCRWLSCSLQSVVCLRPLHLPHINHLSPMASCIVRTIGA